MEKNKRNITKKEKALIIIFSVAVMFSMCIFNQFDVLFRNQVEFGIQPTEVTIIFVLFSLLTLALSLIVLFLTARYSKTGFKIALAVILGFVLASYIQVLFLNSHYNGAFENYAGGYKPISKSIIIINLCIWIILCLLPLSLVIIEKRTKKDFFKKFVALAAVVILAMQVVGFITAAPNADFKRYDKSFYFSVDEQLNLSQPEKENIVVFIIDRAAVRFTDKVFETYPDAKDNFEGFTYYRENISEYWQTFPSVISMLTGESFEETESRAKFSERAWENATLFDELHARGYTVNALLDQVATYHSVKDISGKFDNIQYISDARTVDQWQAVTTMTKISLQRTLPYALKKSAGFDYPNDLNRIVNYSVTDYFPNIIGQESDERFDEKINTRGLSVDNQTNTFSFVHLDCSHATDWLQSTYNTYNMLGEYFSMMKDEGIYENSTIMLIADHGVEEHGKNATLLIKEKGAGGDAMKTDSTTKLSNGFFLSTVFELIGAEDKKPTTSYFDVIHRGAVSERYYYHTAWNVSNRCSFYSKEKVD